jgi:type IV secretion system protein TrbL
MNNAAFVDTVLAKFQAAAHAWEPSIMHAAMWLFGALALLSFVWTFGMLVAKGTELGEVVAELLRFIIPTGIMFWVLTHGPDYAQRIINSLWRLGNQASGQGQGLSATAFLNVAYGVYKQILSQESVWNLPAALMSELCGLLILILAALIAVNIVLVVASSWFTTYLGIIFLGFGGAGMTREMAANYLRTALAIGVRLMTLSVIVGVGLQFFQEAAAAMKSANAGDLGMLVVAALILAVLSHSLPNLVANIASGGHGHGVGNLGLLSGIGAAARSVQPVRRPTVRWKLWRKRPMRPTNSRGVRAEAQAVTAAKPVARTKNQARNQRQQTVKEP